jgi:hypothetical protein
MGGQTTVIDHRQRERDCGRRKMRRRDERGRVPWLYSEQISPSCAVPPRDDNAVGAHFGSAGQGPEMDPQKVS